MPALPLLASVLLTVAFVSSGVFCLRRCVARAGGPTPVDRINDATHVLMSVEMVAMSWSWFLPDPEGIQVAAFATAAGWFLVQAVGAPVTFAALRPAIAGSTAQASLGTGGEACGGRDGGPGHGTRRRSACLHHAILMLVMVWMLTLVSRAGRPSVMASMNMSGLGVSPRVLGTIIAAYCVVVAPLWAVASVRARRRHGGAVVARDLVTYPLMTAAMGVMAVLMR
jgi:hypothetical protein